MGCKVLPPQALRGGPDASKNIFEVVRNGLETGFVATIFTTST